MFVGYHQTAGENRSPSKRYTECRWAWVPRHSGSTSETRHSNRQEANRSQRRVCLATCTGADGDVSTRHRRPPGGAGAHSWVRCCPGCPGCPGCPTADRIQWLARAGLAVGPAGVGCRRRARGPCACWARRPSPRARRRRVPPPGGSCSRWLVVHAEPKPRARRARRKLQAAGNRQPATGHPTGASCRCACAARYADDARRRSCATRPRAWVLHPG